MEPERQALFASAVPRLRNALSARGLFFVAIDLRWGITAEDAQGGEVLRLCLEEVERSTYFVGFIKGRYGWHQSPSAPRDPLLAASLARAAESFPFVRRYEDRSVTEIEMLLGAFVDPQGAPRVRPRTARFYFAAPGLAAADAGAEGPHAASRLAALKGAIVAAGLPLRAPEYTSPEDLCFAIHDDILQMVERDYPRGGERTWLEGERLAHADYADARRRVYVPPAPALAALEQYATAAGPELLVVEGPSGAGKSALLANWASAWQGRHPSDLVLAHFIGGSRQSSRVAGLLRRVYEELRLLDPNLPELPNTPTTGGSDEMLAFRGWIEGAAASLSRRAVLAIDAADQLLDEHGAQNLPWLPPASRSLRLVLSCVPGNSRAHAAALARPHVRMLVPPLGRADRRALVEADLAASSKSLSSATLERVCAAEQCASPLFLLTLLAYVKDGATHETLDRQLADCLACPGPTAVLALTLRRWCGRYGDRLVRDALGAIACARFGMADAELLQFLEEGGMRVTPLRWSELMSAASSLLVNRDGLWSIFHRAALEAVESQLGLASDAERSRMHARLGTFFASQAPSQRRALEGPWQLHRAGDMGRLAALLGDVDMLRRLYRSGTDREMIQLWTATGRAPEAAAAYRAALATEEKRLPQGADRAQLCADYSSAGMLLQELGQAHGAVPFLERALQLAREARGETHQAALAMNHLANLYTVLGRLDEAEDLLKRSLAISEGELGPDHVDLLHTLSRLGFLQQAKGLFDDTEATFKRSLEIAERGYGPMHTITAGASTNLAILLQARGKLGEAEALLRRAVEAHERASGRDDPTAFATLSSLGSLLQAQNKLEEAEGVFKRCLAMAESTFGPRHATTAGALANLASLYRAQRRLPEAEEAARRSVAVKEEALGPDNPDIATSLQTLAGILVDTGRIPEAEAAIRRCATIKEQALGTAHPAVRQGYAILANFLVGVRPRPRPLPP